MKIGSGYNTIEGVDAMPEIETQALLNCPVCKFQGKALLSHIRKDHRMTAAEFKSQFPDSPLRQAWMKGKTKDDPMVAKIAQASRDAKRGKRGNENNAALPEGQWSRQYDACVKCGTTNYPHAAKGLCSKCRISGQEFKITYSDKSKWSEEEDKILSQYYPVTRLKDLVLYLSDKSIDQIKIRLRMLGINNSSRKLTRQQLFRNHLPEVLTPKQEQIFIGSMLGDGHIYNNGNNTCCFAETHSINQADYLSWKTSEFQNLGSSLYNYPERNISELYTSYNDMWEEYWKKWYINDGTKLIKRINKEDFEKIDFLGLAVWIGDDGSPHGKGMRIETCCFTDEENRYMAQFLSKKFSIQIEERKTSKGYNRLWIGSGAYTKIISSFPEEISRISSISHKFMDCFEWE